MEADVLTFDININKYRDRCGMSLQIVSTFVAQGEIFVYSRRDYLKEEQYWPVKMNGNSGLSSSILIAWFSMTVIAMLHVCEANKTDEILKVPYIFRTTRRIQYEYIFVLQNEIDFQNQPRTTNSHQDKSNGL